jgi:capsid protein
LRRIASGLESEYTMLSNDLEGVNMSSIRHGKLDARESRKCQQRVVVQHFLRPLFARAQVGWLACFLLSGQSPLPYSKFTRFANAEWRGRRWPYMDPLVEAQANEILVRHAHTTDSAIAAEMGEDWEENLATVRHEMTETSGTPVDNRFLPPSAVKDVAAAMVSGEGVKEKKPKGETKGETK